MKLISKTIEEKFSSLEDSFDDDDKDYVEDFRRTLVAALSHPQYSRVNLLYDIRTGLNSYKGTLDQNGCFHEDIQKCIERISCKAQVCIELGLASEICTILLTDLCDPGLYGGIARDVAEEMGSELFYRFASQLHELNNEGYDRVCTEAFMLGFIKNMAVDIIAKPGNYKQKPAEQQHHLSCFAKLTGRRDVVSLLQSNGKRKIVSDDLSL